MTLHILGCENAPDHVESGRMTAEEFLARLPRVQFPLHWFADYTGANVRTVKRWASEDLDIPAWVPRILALHERLTEALAWSEEHGDLTATEITWRFHAHQVLWAKDEAMLAARASQREARRVVSAAPGSIVHNINGNIHDNRVENILIVDKNGNPTA